MKNHKVAGTLRRAVVLLSVVIVLLPLTGCTVSFTQSDALQLSLSEPTDKTVSLVSEFETSETDNVAGDVTQKTGSVCAGGVCIIY